MGSVFLLLEHFSSNVSSSFSSLLLALILSSFELHFGFILASFFVTFRGIVRAGVFSGNAQGLYETMIFEVPASQNPLIFLSFWVQFSIPFPYLFFNDF